MSLTIVNSSNWDNEDYAIIIDGKCKILKSTEMIQISPNQKFQDAYPVAKRESDRSKPFLNEDGEQFLPHVEVVMRSPVCEPMTPEEIMKLRSNSPNVVESTEVVAGSGGSGGIGTLSGSAGSGGIGISGGAGGKGGSN